MPEPDLKKQAKEKAKRLRDLARKAEAAAKGDAYESHRERAGERQREIAAAGKEIGPIPPVADPDRRESCRMSLRAFCETYLGPHRFWFAWSADQLKVIDKLERAILRGGLFALAMPRGSGKTTLTEAGALWSLLYGHRRFVVLIGATDKHAVEMMESVKFAVEGIDELNADFPEVVKPIRALEGINQRAVGQTVNGVRTRITWTDNEAVFPTVEGAVASGARLYTASITGRIRGIKATLSGGRSLRPDFAVADDPQTDDTAISPATCAKYERRLKGAIKGLAGPGKTITLVVPCTVIAPGDLSDRILDRDRNPQFQGERMKAVYRFPDAAELWEKYAELRLDSLRDDGRGEEATAFYRENRAAMDAGAEIAWPDSFDPDEEVSALQALMNKKIDTPAEFWAEYQNEPMDASKTASAKELAPAEVCKRLSGLPRFEVPRESTTITAFIDAGGGRGRGLWYAVAAWDQGFGGTALDYGCWPRQARPNFAADDMRPGLAELYQQLSEDARLYRGLTDLAAEVLGRTYRREKDGGEMRVERCLVDCGYKTSVVYQWCRQSPFAAMLFPSKGIARTQTARGVSEWKPRAGERAGYHWRLTISESERGRSVQFDPDMWKSRLYEMLTAPLGGKGCLTLFGEARQDRRDERAHEMLCEHLAAETAEPREIRGTYFDKWTERPHRPDNHWLDCFTGCAVAASVAGLTFSAAAAAGMTDAVPAPAPKPRKSLAEKMREKRGGLDADGRPVISWK